MENREKQKEKTQGVVPLENRPFVIKELNQHIVVVQETAYGRLIDLVHDEVQIH